MPCCSTLVMAVLRNSSSLTRLLASSSTSILKASLTVILRVFFFSFASPANMPLSCSAISSIPGGLMISICGAACATSISISVASSWPSRRRLRNVWRVAFSSRRGEPSAARGGAIRTSRIRSSAASSACARTRFMCSCRVCLMDISAKSRMMVSTSRPT